MRDILNLLDSLAESRGLSGRKPGAIYKRGDTPDDQIVFQNLTFYPKVGQYATKEETEAVFDQVQKQLRHPIEKINEPSNSLKAFAIATFDTLVGTRYLLETSNLYSIQTNSFKPMTFLGDLVKQMLVVAKKT